MLALNDMAFELNITIIFSESGSTRAFVWIGVFQGDVLEKGRNCDEKAAGSAILESASADATVTVTPVPKRLATTVTPYNPVRFIAIANSRQGILTTFIIDRFYDDILPAATYLAYP